MSGLNRPLLGAVAVVASIGMSLAATSPAGAQANSAVLFQNVRIFDGKNSALSAPSSVLVRNGKIEKISAATISAADAQVIDGGQRVLMHLLAPNYRPQQVTDDLASFWRNTYPVVRKELRGRYPRHPWPEDPLSANPKK